MKTPGDLIQSADYALAFRRLEPAPETPHRMLVLLHGWGSDETQMIGLGSSVDARTLVVLPRAPRSADAETFGWYHVTFDAGEPQVLVDEMNESLDKLIEFVAQLQSHHDIAPSRTMVAGFSQGGALAASIALAKPTCVAGFAMIAGRLLPETDTDHGDAFFSLRALVVHGRQDQTLPPDHATQTAGHLQRLGIEHALHLHDAGHALTAPMQADVAAWFDDPQQPWNV